jgi:hypothetical protein
VRTAWGTIAFEYLIDDADIVDCRSDKEIMEVYKDKMVDDIIETRFSDIRPYIDMEII